MNPAAWRWCSSGRTAPRACGDEPPVPIQRRRGRYCSPCVRGWTRVLDGQAVVPDLLPACAGMDPCTTCPCPGRGSAARVCGDGPVYHLPLSWARICSPRVRGWTRDCRGRPDRGPLLPAHAGLIPFGGYGEVCEGPRSVNRRGRGGTSDSGTVARPRPLPVLGRAVRRGVVSRCARRRGRREGSSSSRLISQRPWSQNCGCRLAVPRVLVAEMASCAGRLSFARRHQLSTLIGFRNELSCMLPLIDHGCPPGDGWCGHSTPGHPGGATNHPRTAYDDARSA